MKAKDFGQKYKIINLSASNAFDEQMGGYVKKKTYFVSRTQVICPFVGTKWDKIQARVGRKYNIVNFETNLAFDVL